MRAHGCIHSGSGLGADAHACWGFDRRQEFLDAALEYLTDGLREGQRIAYVGSEPLAEQRERLEPLGGVGSMIDEGALQLFELRDLYEVGRPVDAGAQLASYAAATDAALADGFTGLRVAAQVTNLLAEPATWDAHLRWESVADRFMSVRPLSALCGYQRDLVPERMLGELSAVHPETNAAAAEVPFHLFASEGEMVLSGEVDHFSAAVLDRVLGVACDGAEPVDLDLWELGFIDHRGLEVLARHTRRLAAAAGCSVRNTPPVVERLCGLLDLEL
ncbi:MAG: MEDS domain-containing protein [Solirubrobacterales bacterium]